MSDLTHLFDDLQDTNKTDKPARSDLEAKLTSDSKLTYDKAARQVLSNKRIVAEILHEVVSEFEATSIKNIMSQLPSGVNDSKVKCLATESVPADMATVKFDIDVMLEGILGCSSIEINIEPQRKTAPSYSLYKRAMYYASRMIDQQLSQGDNNYDKLHKCYSIWICFQADNVSDLDILRYRMQTLKSVSTPTDKAKASLQTANKDMDLMNAVFVFVPTAYTEHLAGLRKTLYGVFHKDTKATAEIFTPAEWKEIEEEVNRMGELEREIREESRAEGRAEGIAAVITTLTQLHQSKAEIISRLIQLFSLTHSQAESYYSQYTNSDAYKV